MKKLLLMMVCFIVMKVGVVAVQAAEVPLESENTLQVFLGGSNSKELSTVPYIQARYIRKLTPRWSVGIGADMSNPSLLELSGAYLVSDKRVRVELVGEGAIGAALIGDVCPTRYAGVGARVSGGADLEVSGEVICGLYEQSVWHFRDDWDTYAKATLTLRKKVSSCGSLGVQASFENGNDGMYETFNRVSMGATYMVTF